MTNAPMPEEFTAVQFDVGYTIWNPEAVEAMRRGDVPRTLRRLAAHHGAHAVPVADIVEDAAIRIIDPEQDYVPGNTMNVPAIRIRADGTYFAALICTSEELSDLAAWLDRFAPDWRTAPGLYGGTAVTLTQYDPIRATEEMQRGDWLALVESRMSGNHRDHQGL